MYHTKTTPLSKTDGCYLENGVLYVAVDEAKYLDEKQVDGVDREGGMETQETPVRYV